MAPKAKAKVPVKKEKKTEDLVAPLVSDSDLQKSDAMLADKECAQKARNSMYYELMVSNKKVAYDDLSIVCKREYARKWSMDPRWDHFSDNKKVFKKTFLKYFTPPSHKIHGGFKAQKIFNNDNPRTWKMKGFTVQKQIESDSPLKLKKNTQLRKDHQNRKLQQGAAAAAAASLGVAAQRAAPILLWSFLNCAFFFHFRGTIILIF